jgi:hypothetical protein
MVLIGARPEGRKEMVGFTDGARESAQDRRDLLLDLKSGSSGSRSKSIVFEGMAAVRKVRASSFHPWNNQPGDPAAPVASSAISTRRRMSISRGWNATKTPPWTSMNWRVVGVGCGHSRP